MYGLTDLDHRFYCKTIIQIKFSNKKYWSKITIMKSGFHHNNFKFKNWIYFNKKKKLKDKSFKNQILRKIYDFNILPINIY